MQQHTTSIMHITPHNHSNPWGAYAYYYMRSMIEAIEECMTQSTLWPDDFAEYVEILRRQLGNTIPDKLRDTVLSVLTMIHQSECKAREEEIDAQLATTEQPIKTKDEDIPW